MFEQAKEKYKNSEYKVLLAKVIDKYTFCQTRNKIMYTDFLNMTEKAIIEEVLKKEHIENYIFFGGKEQADRNILILYPQKFSIEMVEKNYENIVCVIRIQLPSQVKYEHREFLSGIMKLGIKREKIGDIFVTESGADIISLNENANYLMRGLKELTRFRKSKITIESITNVSNIETQFEDIKVMIASVRLDNFVSELAKCSRTKAEEMINEGRVFVNAMNEMKSSKRINAMDCITIRGKGKFIFDGIEKETRNGKLLVNIRKYK